MVGGESLGDMFFVWLCVDGMVRSRRRIRVV
jgi:hypothetical protein